MYQCGPVIIKDEQGGWKCVAAGPTTSIREEPYQAQIIRELGLRGVIGKGGMGERTVEACKQHGCVYQPSSTQTPGRKPPGRPAHRPPTPPATARRVRCHGSPARQRPRNRSDQHNPVPRQAPHRHPRRARRRPRRRQMPFPPLRRPCHHRGVTLRARGRDGRAGER
ncbi:MAG: fumarate hydratase C-terminal domain-containing protein [Streptosporangiaceae bacterium]